MDEIIEQLTESCAGLTPEEILAQVEQCPNVPPEKAPIVAAWLASLSA